MYGNSRESIEPFNKSQMNIIFATFLLISPSILKYGPLPVQIASTCSVPFRKSGDLNMGFNVTERSEKKIILAGVYWILVIAKDTRLNVGVMHYIAIYYNSFAGGVWLTTVLFHCGLALFARCFTVGHGTDKEALVT